MLLHASWFTVVIEPACKEHTQKRAEIKVFNALRYSDRPGSYQQFIMESFSRAGSDQMTPRALSSRYLLIVSTDS